MYATQRYKVVLSCPQLMSEWVLEWVGVDVQYCCPTCACKDIVHEIGSKEVWQLGGNKYSLCNHWNSLLVHHPSFWWKNLPLRRHSAPLSQLSQFLRYIHHQQSSFDEHENQKEKEAYNYFIRLTPTPLSHDSLLSDSIMTHLMRPVFTIHTWPRSLKLRFLSAWALTFRDYTHVSRSHLVLNPCQSQTRQNILKSTNVHTHSTHTATSIPFQTLTKVSPPPTRFQIWYILLILCWCRSCAPPPHDNPPV